MEIRPQGLTGDKYQGQKTGYITSLFFCLKASLKYHEGFTLLASPAHKPLAQPQTQNQGALDCRLRLTTQKMANNFMMTLKEGHLKLTWIMHKYSVLYLYTSKCKIAEIVSFHSSLIVSNDINLKDSVQSVQAIVQLELGPVIGLHNY